ncbi:hypothetical protein SPLC1_S530110 [Arthrospira platensis C1]|nr:hypothetical protein SPLC1_S530110 [Arthrospira platensis C1]
MELRGGGVGESLSRPKPGIKAGEWWLLIHDKISGQRGDFTKNGGRS